MKDYELVVVFHPDLEMNIDPALDKVKSILDSNGANITKEEVDGKKRLAYEIKKQEFGLYYYYELQLPSDAPGKISNAFNIADEIIRYQLVKVDPRKDKLATKRAAKTANTHSDSADTTNPNSEEE